MSIHYNQLEKIRVIQRVMHLRNCIMWSANRRGESIREYSERVLYSHLWHQRLGELIKNEFIEFYETIEERERLAIVSFIAGLRPHVKRYMAPPECYKNLFEVVNHAERVNLQVKSLQKATRISIIPSVRKYV